MAKFIFPFALDQKEPFASFILLDRPLSLRPDSTNLHPYQSPTEEVSSCWVIFAPAYTRILATGTVVTLRGCVSFERTPNLRHKALTEIQLEDT